ncbi:oligosaccharide biosynthesis protein Alg14 like protein, partial [Trametes versicolor FP-101664 SS1]|uniref:oligosaccharide biosynthesis protein Alg14 like protein n=1 Tax=Trametes versicolor (strain FP-101664) TaxID=717944 RepID=UPI000462234C
VAILFLARLYTLLTVTRAAKRGGRRRPADSTCSLAVFLGSGGHTSEALCLLSALDFSRYFPRTYFISEGDSLSMRKALELEALKAADAQGSPRSTPYTFVVIPRARHVHQSLLTTPATAAVSLAAAVWHLTIAPSVHGTPISEVLLLNGPGTCFVLCIAAYLNRICALSSPTLIYVESFARVRRLSLSGKLLRRLVDRFIVQWPDLARDDKGAEYRGWLV